MVLTKGVSLKHVITQGMNVRWVHDEGVSMIHKEAEGMSDHNVRICGKGFLISSIVGGGAAWWRSIDVGFPSICIVT